ncbi:MAG: hypothetical protein EP343_05885 [Deltaproteobacteria bacterium]|nr:MAG: hypothetical protein EP343_05885 [Deltaproteobacteria bacterium]
MVNVFATKAYICFHVAEQGKCYLLLAEREPLPLRAGDLVMLPSGLRHAIVNAVEAVPQPLSRLCKAKKPSHQESFAFTRMKLPLKLQASC